MANTFKNYVATLTDATETTVYTVPDNTTGIIIGLNIASTASSQVKASVKVAATHVVKNVPIPTGSALSVLDGKLIGEAADEVTVQSDSSTGDIEVIVSVLEQT